jgi:hypothetical protein
LAIAQLVARINSGIVQAKGICYEFIDGFVSRNAIVGIVQEIFANIRRPKIGSRKEEKPIFSLL